MSATAIGSTPAKGSSSSMKVGLARRAPARSRSAAARRPTAPSTATCADARCGIPRAARRAGPRARLLVLLHDLEHGPDVVLDREAAKDRGFLRQIADAEARAPVHRHLRDVVAVEFDPAGVDRDEAGDHVEAGRLARAVRAEQADRLAAADVHVDAVDDAAAAIGLGDAARDQRADPGSRIDGPGAGAGGLHPGGIAVVELAGRVGHAPPSLIRSASRAALPARPQSPACRLAVPPAFTAWADPSAAPSAS